MSKYNLLKIVIFLKSMQIFLYITIFAFILTIFISSIPLIDEKIFLWNHITPINDLTVGFYKIILHNSEFDSSISNAFIAYNIILIACLITFIVNALILKIRFGYVKRQFFKSAIIFAFLILAVLTIMYSVYFCKGFSFLPNTNDNKMNLNFIIQYSSVTSGDYTIANYELSTNGIIYTALLAPVFAILIFFPIKIIYNLIRVSYI